MGDDAWTDTHLPSRVTNKKKSVNNSSCEHAAGTDSVKRVGGGSHESCYITVKINVRHTRFALTQGLL